MRTTVTLDDHLARRLKDEMRARGTTFRETLENVLIRGLDKNAERGTRKPFRFQARSMGLKSGMDLARLSDLETEMDIERFVRVSRKGRGKS